MSLDKAKADNKKTFGLPLKNRMKDFSAHIPIFIEKKNYIVKTADSNEELMAALKLRHEVFLEELLQKKKKNEIDIDRFDKLCDHIIIVDKRNEKVIGTYRLQSSLHSKKWYTASEFQMKEIKKLPGIKLELGRACVHPDYRNGITIALLWEGIKAYVELSGTNYLFGCSSVKTTDKNEIREIYDYLYKNGYLSKEHNIRPRKKYKVPGAKRLFKTPAVDSGEGHNFAVKDKIPSLLASYFKVGAKVHGTPALDKSFRCIDFLTLLDTRNLQEKKLRKISD